MKKKKKIPKDRVIIDIGCGKGRVLFIAAEFGFKEVRGLEVSPVLCETAENNITIYKEITKTETNFNIINTDAGQHEFLDDGDVYFLYNPFNEIILKKVLKSISESLQRKKRNILIIYAYPVKKKFIEEVMPIQSTRNFKIWGSDFAVFKI